MPDPNVSVVRECRPLPVEFVVPRLPDRLDLDLDLDRLRARRAPLLRAPPARRACAATSRCPSRCSRRPPRRQQGEHDELTSREELIARGALGGRVFDAARASRAALFAEGTRFAATRGLILVDTKYEMGLDDERASSS